MVMKGDAPVLESGGTADLHYGGVPGMHFPPATVDRLLNDGDSVTLGGTALSARLTPGHTKGCTTWTFEVREGGRAYSVAVVGSPNVNPGYRLFDNRAYPTIADDFERTFQVLRSLRPDIFLGAHGAFFNLARKYERVQRGERYAFVDPEGYALFVEERERAYVTEREKQRRARLPESKSDP
jgi:metallo-beta-lactamase class B